MFRLFITPWTVKSNEVINPIVTVINGIHGRAGCSMIWGPSKVDGTPSLPHCLVVVNADAGYDWLALEALPGIKALPVTVDFMKAISVAEATILTGKLSEFGLSVTMGDRIDLAYQKIAASIHPHHKDLDKYLRDIHNTPKPRGTFTDDFTAGSDEYLDVRTGWALEDAAATNYIQVQSSNNVIRCVKNDRALYTCTNQGSADNYVQARLKSLTAQAGNCVVSRAVDKSNFVGWRLAGTGASGSRLSKEVAGVFTDLYTHQGVDESVYKIEVDGSNVILYEDDIDLSGTQTYSENTTETSQGLRSQGLVAADWIDDFEAGTLAAPPAGVPNDMYYKTLLQGQM